MAAPAARLVCPDRGQPAAGAPASRTCYKGGGWRDEGALVWLNIHQPTNPLIHQSTNPPLAPMHYGMHHRGSYAMHHGMHMDNLDMDMGMDMDMACICSAPFGVTTLAREREEATRDVEAHHTRLHVPCICCAYAVRVHMQCMCRGYAV